MKNRLLLPIISSFIALPYFTSISSEEKISSNHLSNVIKQIINNDNEIEFLKKSLIDSNKKDVNAVYVERGSGIINQEINDRSYLEIKEKLIKMDSLNNMVFDDDYLSPNKIFVLTNNYHEENGDKYLLIKKDENKKMMHKINDYYSSYSSKGEIIYLDKQFADNITDEDLSKIFNKKSIFLGKEVEDKKIKELINQLR